MPETDATQPSAKLCLPAIGKMLRLQEGQKPSAKILIHRCLMFQGLDVGEVRPGRLRKPLLESSSETPLTDPSLLPGLGTVDEMIDIGPDLAFEIETHEVAHEVEARRQFRDITLERGIERALFEAKAKCGIGLDEAHGAFTQLGFGPGGAIDHGEAVVEIEDIGWHPEGSAIGLE